MPTLSNQRPKPRPPRALEGPTVYRTMFTSTPLRTSRSVIAAAILAVLSGAVGALPAAAQFATPQTVPQGGAQQAPAQQAPQQQAPRPAPPAVQRQQAPQQPPAAQARPSA